MYLDLAKGHENESRSRWAAIRALSITNQSGKRGQFPCSVPVTFHLSILQKLDFVLLRELQYRLRIFSEWFDYRWVIPTPEEGAIKELYVPTI
ncbi:MAG: hypothetical protein IPK32_06470 [Verrucomicrobiaceae bacterium]|nr:hypothetical protein [Verrucomicrobiaceae bacterium]